MKKNISLMLMGAVLFLAGCEALLLGKPDQTRDHGLDSKPLSELKAGIWIDPNGCDHWIIDDGIEGYLSPRLDRDGKPVCSGDALAGKAIGDFKGGSSFADAI
jgi:hypothetical protein